MEKIQIKTQDGLTLSALYQDNQAEKSVVLLHMMPATKESWLPLMEKLSGFNVLALDLRGHGESAGGDYTAFTPEQHQQYILDAEAGAESLLDKHPGTELLLGGASIGANISLQYMANHPEVGKGFCLSAGLDYYGVKASDFAAQLKPTQQVLFVGAMDDGRKVSDCGTMAKELAEKCTGKPTLQVYEYGGHGTDMWSAHPELLERIIEFLNN